MQLAEQAGVKQRTLLLERNLGSREGARELNPNSALEKVSSQADLSLPNQTQDRADLVQRFKRGLQQKLGFIDLGDTQELEYFV